MLNRAEREESGWLKIKEFVSLEIESLRKKNDSALSETETASLRGEIKALKRLLEKAEPKELRTTPKGRRDY